jgi:hypothetical protein
MASIRGKHRVMPNLRRESIKNVSCRRLSASFHLVFASLVFAGSSPVFAGTRFSFVGVRRLSAAAKGADHGHKEHITNTRFIQAIKNGLP